MFELVEDVIDALDPVVLEEEVLDAEVLLQSLQRGQAVVVEPQDLQVGEVLKMHQNCRLPVAQVHLGGLLRLLEVLYRDHVPGVGLDLVLHRLVFGEQMAQSLIHCSYKNDSLLPAERIRLQREGSPARPCASPPPRCAASPPRPPSTCPPRAGKLAA